MPDPMPRRWIAEKVRLSWLIQGAPFYLENPLENGDAPMHRAGEGRPDADVWTLYESWQPDNPWLKREVTRPPRGSGLAAGQLAMYMFETRGLGQTR